MNKRESRWSLQDAKARFSEVVRRSLDQGPQHVTRNGEDTVVVVSAAEFARVTASPATAIAEMLARSPLAAVDLEVERPKESGRKGAPLNA